MTEYHISISDISNFLKCRQMWDYASPNRQSLRHKRTPALYLTEGTALHLAIETAVNGEDPWVAVENYMQTERDNLISALQAEHGMVPWDLELDEFDDSTEFVNSLIKQYFKQYGTTDMLKDQGLTYLAAEVSFKIPVRLSWLPADDTVYFVGTFDGIAVDENEHLWVVEHKTYQGSPDSEDLMYHFQSNGYAVAFKWLTGMDLTGVLYDGVSKRLIQKPKILGNGMVSTDKRQSVTYETYLQGIIEAGQDPYDDRYFEMLTMLAEREKQGDERFFHREKIFYNEHQIANWHVELENIITEMVSEPTIYRTVPFNGCGPRGQGCWYRDLCQTQHSGGDVQFVLDARYQRGTYGTMNAVDGVEPYVVRSVRELKEFLENARQENTA